MSDRSLIFPASEYRQRIARLQAQLAAKDCDALLLTSAADIFYTTGFLTRFWESPARPWFVIVPTQGDPIAVIPSIGADLMGRTWMPDIRTWNAPDPSDDGVTLLSDTLREVTPDTGRIATPMGLETHLRMPLADYHAVTQQIAPRQFVDGTDVIQRVREIKSGPEIAKIRDICQ
ncbi:MAG: aminopeptidase P family N-terminal domain-containing protein, partial [Thalassococcus sp.]|uniref:aminopeptidase P family N-terminal domain-containing protein n=1 Tax=Thalassococcus sp. TaxID=1928858 RepID=UPI001B1052F0